jgi:hypothetical protein
MTFWDSYVSKLEAMSLDADSPGVPLMVLRYEDLCLHFDSVGRCVIAIAVVAIAIRSTPVPCHDGFAGHAPTDAFSGYLRCEQRDVESAHKCTLLAGWPLLRLQSALSVHQGVRLCAEGSGRHCAKIWVRA